MVATQQTSNLCKLFQRLATTLPQVLASPRVFAAPKPRQHQQRLTEQQARELLADYQAGAQMSDLASQYGVHRTTVAEHLRQADIQPRSRSLIKAQIDEAVRLYIGGLSTARIGDQLGCDAETVRKALKARGVTMRKPWERL